MFVSMAKSGLVLVGINEDYIDLRTALWFFPAGDKTYGRILWGYDRPLFPYQGGMNEKGLFIDFNFARETERLAKELGKVAKELASLSRKLQNQDFRSKAPAEVVAKVRDQQQALIEKQQKLQGHLDMIKAYDSAS
jgi:hypothetical protein